MLIKKGQICGFVFIKIFFYIAINLSVNYHYLYVLCLNIASKHCLTIIILIDYGLFAFIGYMSRGYFIC